MSFAAEIQLIAVFISMACALPGVFLVLRKLSMVAESIAHTILLGIVVGFLFTQDLNSPALIVGAALVGLATTWLTEMLSKTKLMSADSSIGIIFTLLFSIGVILLSRYASKTHLCEDTIMMGEIAFTPFDRVMYGGMDLGPVALYVSGLLLLLNIGIISLFYKEFQLSTFDPILAASLGLSPVIMHYALMSLVSLTAVGSFQSIGSILVVAFMIGPPSTAFLIVSKLKSMLWVSCAVAAFNSVTGFHLAAAMDVSISGCMATVTGLSFLCFYLFSQAWLFACPEPS